MLELAALAGLGYLGYRNDWLGNFSDYMSGYTSANQANRFTTANMEKQQEYNRENMESEDRYQRALMADSPSIQREALSKAGFNPLLAVSGGISSPNSAVHASLPSATGPQVTPQLGNLVNLASTAVGGFASLAKLGSEVALNKSQSAAASASALRDAAQAEKTAKEAASIDPKIIRQNNKFGNGFIGDLQKLGRNFLDGLGLDYDARPFANSASSAGVQGKLDNISSESADGIKATINRVEREVDKSVKSRDRMSIYEHDLMQRKGKRWNLPR